MLKDKAIAYFDKNKIYNKKQLFKRHKLIEI